MIRVHIFACTLPDDQTRTLNQESGRIYTATLVHHYRVYRQAGKVWLSPLKHDRVLKAFCGETFLHAHSCTAGLLRSVHNGQSPQTEQSPGPLSLQAQVLPYHHLEEHGDEGD